MCHTYGTWLPGDPKGFCTRHHREHVDGDYKNPPPTGAYGQLHERSKHLMARDAVYLSIAQRTRAVEEIVRSFLKWKIELKILAIDEVHLHALSKVVDHDPRRYMGLAKKECSAYMKRDGLAPAGGLWATRCECLPIEDERHYGNVDGYIRDHRDRRAVVWEPARSVVSEKFSVNDLRDFDPRNLLLD
jgi:hypothetical protein